MNKEQIRVGSESAEVQFYDPASENHRRIKFDHKQMWRGDHRMCNHAGNTCVTPKGWILDGRTWELVPHVVPVSIEERAMGMVVYRGQKGRYPESTQTAKGMVDWNDRFADVKPTDAVKINLLERNLKVLRTDLGKRGAKYAEINAEVAERRSLIEAANGLSKPTKAKKGE